MNLVTRLIEETNRKRRLIMVCGDALVDRWIHGRVEECQDGCPKFVEESYEETPGGAANAARCLQNWNVGVSLYNQGTNAYSIKTRLVNRDGKIVMRHDREHQEDDIGTRQYRHKDALTAVRRMDAVLLSDYDKGFLTQEFITAMIQECKRCGVPCVADAKREPGLYAGAILKGNAQYHEEHCISGPDSVVTIGSTPPTVWSGGVVQNVGCMFQLPRVECCNHVGAGDCFAAHLTLALAYGFMLAEAATVAHSAGRVYVQFPHNRPPLPQEIEADLSAT